MSMQISFPGGVAVAAQIGEFTLLTDQPVASGGQNSAPSPYAMFLASIGTCAGFFALRFCQQREIATEGLGLSLDIERDAESRELRKVKIDIQLPVGFPEKYHKAIIKATDQCAVKQAIIAQPEFAVSIHP
jgi:ribosomal protein S12 methylthiotransferase accessory factor